MDIKTKLIGIFDSMNKVDTEWVNLANYGKELKSNDIDYHSFGYQKLNEFIESLGIFELRRDSSTKFPVCFIKKVSISSNNPYYAISNNNPYYALSSWAYLGVFPKPWEALKKIALEENWGVSTNEKNPYPILSNYLNYTFYKLQKDKEILFSRDNKYAVFNTGLVDKRYLPIYALFKKNASSGNGRDWFLVGFCIEGEDLAGKTLVDKFDKMPQAAHYFNDVYDLLYDTKKEKPSLDYEHILIERVDRLPYEFIESNMPRTFEARDPNDIISQKEKELYFNCLQETIKEDSATYRKMTNRLDDALELAIKRVQWNYKSAIPMYYPKNDKMCLLLPLCLVSDDKVDVALVVSKKDSGRYQGETIYKLDWAYKCARLICRPDSDWLTVNRIKDTLAEEYEE